MTAAFRPYPGLQTAHAPRALVMPDQSLTAPFTDPAAPGVTTHRRTRVMRAATLGLPLLATLTLAALWLRALHAAGPVTAAQYALVGLTALALFWVVLSVATATLGLFWRDPPAPPMARTGLTTAILLPMYGEPAQATIRNAVALLLGLTHSATTHRFSLHILSDTRDPAAVRIESGVARLAASRHPQLDITYRHRDRNTDFKSGNIRDWVRATGAAHAAMLVLDADSVMTPRTVIEMADSLAADPGLGLVQSVPRVAPGETLWQRMQSFASHVYGPTLARGFALWTGPSATFLGHNALIRTAAFATSAGLPHLSGPAPRGGVILSHDFVEAALMRRAGWGVAMLPQASGSHEDTPATLPGYIRRDTRWCQGNMQHLRLLTAPGLHPLSRFHLLAGAMAYLSSVWWLALLILWTLPGAPLAPMIAPLGHGTLAAVIALMLLAPKLIGIAGYLRETAPPRRFVPMALAEIALSIAIAPVLMVHQTRAVLRTAAGINGGWAPHSTARAGLATLARFHAPETVLGLALLTLATFGTLTPWLLPIATSLTLAIPLSWLVQRDVTPFPALHGAPVYP